MPPATMNASRSCRPLISPTIPRKRPLGTHPTQPTFTYHCSIYFNLSLPSSTPKVTYASNAPDAPDQFHRRRCYSSAWSSASSCTWYRHERDSWKSRQPMRSMQSMQSRQSSCSPRPFLIHRYPRRVDRLLRGVPFGRFGRPNRPFLPFLPFLQTGEQWFSNGGSTSPTGNDKVDPTNNNGEQWSPSNKASNTTSNTASNTTTNTPNTTSDTSHLLNQSEPLSFPWKHSPTLPQRILLNNDLSTEPLSFRARLFRRLLAMRELNLSLWDGIPLPPFVESIVGKRAWQVELENNFLMAYEVALCQLLEGLFQVPVTKDENGMISFDIIFDAKEKDQLKRKLSSSELNQFLKTGDMDTRSEVIDWSKLDVDAKDTHLNGMMDCSLLRKYFFYLHTEKLRQMTRAAKMLEKDYEGKADHEVEADRKDKADQEKLWKLQEDICNNMHVQIKLYLQPIEVQLHHLFALPLITREIVTLKPHLRGSIQRISEANKESFTKGIGIAKEISEEISSMDEEQNKKISNGAKSKENGENAEERVQYIGQRTLTADVSIKCLEYFQVVDGLSGEVIQGMNDGEEPEEVFHVVRFEAVTAPDRENGDGKQKKRKFVQNWKIVDWDDLLDGNIFY